jgi:hypothetical protein
VSNGKISPTFRRSVLPSKLRCISPRRGVANIELCFEMVRSNCHVIWTSNHCHCFNFEMGLRYKQYHVTTAVGGQRIPYKYSEISFFSFLFCFLFFCAVFLGLYSLRIPIGTEVRIDTE